MVGAGADTCFIQDTSCADLNSARHGQFQEKEKTPETELKIFFSKKNRRKTINFVNKKTDILEEKTQLRLGAVKSLCERDHFLVSPTY